MPDSNSVFQIVIHGEKLDILPTYRLAMKRHLQLVLDNPAVGHHARVEYDAFLAVFDGDDVDPFHFAVRHAVSTSKPRRDIIEHRMSFEVMATSVVDTYPVDTGFDPSFEVLVSAYWIRTGASSLDEELRRIGQVSRAHCRLSKNRPDLEVVADIARITDRHGGLPLIDPGCDPGREIETLGDEMASWLRRLTS